MSPALRTGLGFAAAVLSVLTFHQGMILLLSKLALFGMPPNAVVWNLAANPRAFGLPTIVNQCFWGGLYGAAYGLIAPRLPLPMWLSGLITGAATTMVGLFVIAAIRGTPVGGGWQMMVWLRGLSIGLSFGLGLSLFYLFLAKLAGKPMGSRETG